MLVLQHAHIGYEHEGESEQSHDLERRLLLPDEPICLPQQPQQQLHRNVAAAVLAAHFLARWAWRSWEFSVALLLVHLYPGSLRLVAVYGLLDDLCSLALGPLAGQFVDRVPRLQAAITMYMAQNACILVSAGSAVLVLLLDSPPGSASKDLLPMQGLALLKGTVVVAGACCSIGSMGATLSVEKDWTKTMTAGDPAALSKLNAGLRAIDLFCQMLAPAAAGITMSYAGMLPAVAVMAAYAAAAWVPEALLLWFAHAHCNLLRAPKTSNHQPPASGNSRRCPVCRPCQALVSGWPVYYSQPTLAAALALAMLYFTVLSLGFLMTSYLKSTGMAEATLSYFRGAGALSGLSATLLFPLLQRKWGLQRTGLLGITWQLAWLCGGVLPVVIAQRGGLQGPQQALQLLLLAGLVASRAGLWLFDLAVGQLQQEAAAVDELGVVAGAQGALQSLFEILSFVAGIAVPDPHHFYLLMLPSLGSVATAAATYSWWCCRVRHTQRARHNERDTHTGSECDSSIEGGGAAAQVQTLECVE